MVRIKRLELPRLRHQILSLARLPFRHARIPIYYSMEWVIMQAFLRRSWIDVESKICNRNENAKQINMSFLSAYF